MCTSHPIGARWAFRQWTLAVVGGLMLGGFTLWTPPDAHAQRRPSLQQRVTLLEQQVAQLMARVATLETMPPGGGGGLPACMRAEGAEVIFDGCNVHIRDGSGDTEGATNGLGNLIIGYNEDAAPPNNRMGSHNLVIGPQHTYSSHGGLVAGLENTISGPRASVTGGALNTASGDTSSVSGGIFNQASADNASVSGGISNLASGVHASVSGGQDNVASGLHSSVSGGQSNIASGDTSSVSGGIANEASADNASISGGQFNFATGLAASVSGGANRGAVGTSNWVAGGLLQNN